MTATETTFTGICQACGRRQAIHVHTGLIAKHGYTTDWGFFNGTCGGSDHLPLELDTAVNLAVVGQLRTWVGKLEAEAGGEILKVQIQTGSSLVRGKRVAEYKLVDRAEFEACQPRYSKFDYQVELVRRRLRRQAEIARANADDLDQLREEVHGQPLQPRVEEAPLQRETFRTYREAHARVNALKLEGVAARQRRQAYVGFVVTYRA